MVARRAAPVWRDWDRKLDPFPSGRSWYGNYTGPGNERSDWEEDHLPPQTPLDRAPMQHDQDYSAIEERYGYGKYETGPDGKTRWRGGDNSFLMMRFDTEHEFLHTALIESDLRLMWRSGWYIGEGLWNGQYDLTFSKGPRGAVSLVTDLLVFGVIQGVFPLLVGLDAAFLSLTIAKHTVQGLGRLAQGLGNLTVASGPGWGTGDFIPEDWKKEWDYLVKKFQYEFWQYKPFPNATTGWKGDFFGYGSWEIGIRNVTMLDIAITAITFALGPSLYGVYMGTATFVEYVGAQALSSLAKWVGKHLDGGMISPGASWVQGIGRGASDASSQVTRSAVRAGAQLRREAGQVGRNVSSGAKHFGGEVSNAAKSAGRRASDWGKSAGGAIFRGAKDAGGKLSDAWKGATGGGGGGCFLTTACTQALSAPERERILTAFRTFRDGVLLSTLEGAALVASYYAVAPRIVDKIDASPTRRDEYESLYRDLVLPTYRCLLDERWADAVAVYHRGVRDLERKWLPCEFQARMPSDIPGSQAAYNDCDRSAQGAQESNLLALSQHAP